MRERIVREARRLLGEDVIEDEPLAKHCSFRIGGPAKLFLQARNLSPLRKALPFCRDSLVPFFVLGRGTNLLVPDSGFDGMVMCMRAGTLVFTPRGVFAEAGAPLQKVATAAAEQGLAGMEFSAGIPGSVGGAVMMNAGAHGKSIGSLIEFVVGLDLDGKEEYFRKRHLRFGYRESSLQEFQGIVAGVSFALGREDPRAIEERMESMLAIRRRAQPVSARCAGSIFKNPPRDYAGRLIELAGCKGMQCGGAAVSRKHANFIVNRGGASYCDVKALIEAVRERVRKVHGVELELEIIDLGEK